jgi:hypothetical protein
MFITFESCVYAFGIHRFYISHLHNEIFCEIVLKADEECIVIDGVYFFVGNFLFDYGCRGRKFGFEENFVEDLFIGAVDVEVITFDEVILRGSQSTDSLFAGLSVPIDGSWMIRKHSAFFLHLNPNRSLLVSISAQSVSWSRSQ